MYRRKQNKKMYGEWPTMDNFLSKHEKEHLIKTLIETKGNIQHASRLLEMARNTLKERIEQYNIDCNLYKNLKN